jgi:DNA-binding response OmpR family regulator
MSRPLPIANILILDSDIKLLELIEFHLEKSFFHVVTSTSIKNLESSLKVENIDLAIIEHSLKELDVNELVKYLRDKGIDIPIVFLGNENDFSKIENGYLSGGDDYIVKPFNIKELIFRIKAILKRTKIYESDRLLHRDITVDINSRKVYIEDREIALTKLEFNLLGYFIKNKNRIIDREILLKQVWNEESTNRKQTVTVTINRLRKKIDPKNTKEYIVPIYGLGYKFV